MVKVLMDSATRWGQIAVMLATAAGLFVSSQDTKSAVLKMAEAIERLSNTVAVLDERVKHTQMEAERTTRRLEALEDRRR